MTNNLLATKVSDFIAQLNDSCSSIRGTKMGHGEFHNAVKEATKAIIGDGETNGGIRLFSWFIKFDYNLDLIKYDRDFKKDARYSSYEEKGWFSNVRFTCEYDNNLTVGEIVMQAKRKALRDRIEGLNKLLDELNAKCLGIVEEISKLNLELLNSIN